MPPAPPPPLSPTGRPHAGIVSRARRVPLPGGQPGAALPRVLAPAVALGHGRVAPPRPFGPRRARLPAVRADALAPWGHGVRPHPTPTRVDSNGGRRPPRRAGGPGRSGARLPIGGSETADSERRAPHVCGPSARPALRLGRDVALGLLGPPAWRRRPDPGLSPPVAPRTHHEDGPRHRLACLRGRPPPSGPPGQRRRRAGRGAGRNGSQGSGKIGLKTCQAREGAATMASPRRGGGSGGPPVPPFRPPLIGCSRGTRAHLSEPCATGASAIGKMHFPIQWTITRRNAPCAPRWWAERACCKRSCYGASIRTIG
jgi:hypothetical protein